MIENLPIPRRSACLDSNAVLSCAGLENPPVRRIKGGFATVDDATANNASREKRVNRACLGDVEVEVNSME